MNKIDKSLESLITLTWKKTQIFSVRHEKRTAYLGTTSWVSGLTHLSKYPMCMPWKCDEYINVRLNRVSFSKVKAYAKILLFLVRCWAPELAEQGMKWDPSPIAFRGGCISIILVLQMGHVAWSPWSYRPSTRGAVLAIPLPFPLPPPEISAGLSSCSKR